MRYNDWDVLLFPGNSVVPVKEFRVDCQLVHDIEFSTSNGLASLPTMTCFVPSLDAGSPFQISIHSWSANPEISQFAKTFNKHAELLQFEARVFIDGYLVASAILDPMGQWPCQIYNSFDAMNDGSLDSLRFPLFQNETLRQQEWSAADDLGRVKVIISEGFPRASMAVPVERVKNVVAFSFQHAPLSILETAGLAWPSPSLWLRNSTLPYKPVPTYSCNDGPQLHTHSPRRSRRERTAVSKDQGPGGKDLLRRDYRWGRADDHHQHSATWREKTPPSLRQPDRLYRRMYRTPPPPENLDSGRRDLQQEKSCQFRRSGTNTDGQKQTTSDSSMPGYATIPLHGQGPWLYPDPQAQLTGFMGSSLNGNMSNASNTVPTNTAAPTTTDSFLSLMNEDPHLCISTLEAQPQVLPASYATMLPQANQFPVQVSNNAQPPSLPASADGSLAAPHVRDGGPVSSFFLDGRFPQDASGSNPPKEPHKELGIWHDQPSIGLGMDGCSSSLSRFKFAPSVNGNGGTSSTISEQDLVSIASSRSNMAGDDSADAGVGRISPDTTNVAPGQGRSQGTVSAVLCPEIPGSSDLSDEVIMQALAQA